MAIVDYEEMTHQGVKLRSLRFEDYWAGKDGHIYSAKRKGFRKLKPLANKKLRGLQTVTLYCRSRMYERVTKSGKTIYTPKPWPQYIHLLIASVWLPPKPSPKHEIDHRDENRSNNRPNNLRWVTSKQNTQSFLANHPEFQKGDNNHNAKLCDEAIPGIRALKGVVIARVIAGWFGVKRKAIMAVWQGRTWKHVPENATENTLKITTKGKTRTRKNDAKNDAMKEVITNV